MRCAQRFFHPFVCILLAAAAAQCVAPSRAIAQSEEYRRALIASAEARQLAHDPQWHALLHLEEPWLGRMLFSAVQSPSFFLSPEGARDPKAEMAATLGAFFDPPLPPAAASDTDPPQHPQCRFAARFEWLNRELGFDRSKLPVQPCERLEAWYGAIRPLGLTLIFPASYLNNPASAFGHTLLRIDQPDQNERTRLLAYTANFAAHTGGEGGVIYALKGVFGGYPGFFSVAPYYEKVKKYSDLEKRDIWEYRLALTAAEVRMLVLHLWELRGVAFDYYYFDLNCSYQLLALLDTARPALGLRHGFRSWVIPVDTVRAVTSVPQLVEAAIFRPSVSTQLGARIANTPTEALGPARRLGLLDESPEQVLRELSGGEERAAALELGYDYLNYQILSGKRSRPEDSRRAFELLRLRSDSTAPAHPLAVEAPAVRPDQGHESSRVGLGIGSSDGETFAELRLRPAFHDHLDPLEGFASGAQIQLFETRIREYEGGEVELEQATLLDIQSLSPRDRFFRPLSWDFNLGFERRAVQRGERTGVMNLRGGAGWSARPFEPVLSYLLINLNNEFSNGYDSEYAIGSVPEFGLLIDPRDEWRLALFVNGGKYFLGDTHSQFAFGLRQRLTLGRNTALRVNLEQSRVFGTTTPEVSISLDYYL